jgi:hypothetical protein
VGSRSRHSGLSSSAERFRRDVVFRLEVMFLEVAGYLLDRWGLGPDHLITTFWARKEPLSPEVLKKAQAFLEQKCGALVTGTISHADQWTGPAVGESLRASEN